MEISWLGAPWLLSHLVTPLKMCSSTWAYGICWIVSHDDFRTSSHVGETQQEWWEPPCKVCDGSRELRYTSHPAGMLCHRTVTGVMVYQARELCPSHQVQPAAQERRPDLNGCGLCVQCLASQWPFHVSCTGHYVIVTGFAVAWIKCSQLVCCFKAVEQVYGMLERSLWFLICTPWKLPHLCTCSQGFWVQRGRFEHTFVLGCMLRSFGWTQQQHSHVLDTESVWCTCWGLRAEKHVL